jgi:hypothetical protein
MPHFPASQHRVQPPWSDFDPPFGWSTLTSVVNDIKGRLRHGTRFGRALLRALKPDCVGAARWAAVLALLRMLSEDAAEPPIPMPSTRGSPVNASVSLATSLKIA